MKVFEAAGKCLYRRADSIRDHRPTADYRMGIHPQLANVDLAVYGDLAVGRVVILNNPPPLPCLVVLSGSLVWYL